MNRRELYQWLTRALGAAVAAVVVIPGVRFLLDPLHRRSTTTDLYKRVARLDELELETPKEVIVTGTRQDAWTTYRDEVLGRVWLVKKSSPSEAPGEADVAAFTAVCPHEGCIVQLDLAGEQFVCPCHRAAFFPNGKRLSAEELGHDNPSPRDLDTLPSRIQLDEATGEWWVEVQYHKYKLGGAKQELLEG